MNKQDKQEFIRLIADELIEEYHVAEDRAWQMVDSIRPLLEDMPEYMDNFGLSIAKELYESIRGSG